MVHRAPVGGRGLHGHQAVRVVEEVHGAHLRVGEAHERLQTAGGERAHVERLELAHELRVGAGARVAQGEGLVGAGEVREGLLAIGQRGAQARVLLEEQGVHLRQAARDRSELVASRGQRRDGLEAARRGERLFELSRRARDVARDPRAAPERDDDREEQDRARRALRGGCRVERDLLALVGVLEGVAPEVGEDAAHLVGARLALVGHGGVGHVTALAHADLRLAHGEDPVADQPPERRDALVLHPVLGDVLRLGEEALEIATRLLVRSEKRAVAREQVPALARLEVHHQPQELLGVVGELQVVLHQPLELLLELLMGIVGARETHAEDGDDQERTEEDAPEESALDDVQGFWPSGRKLSLRLGGDDGTST